MKSSKIVAGLEPENTNILLQTLGFSKVDFDPNVIFDIFRKFK